LGAGGETTGREAWPQKQLAKKGRPHKSGFRMIPTHNSKPTVAILEWSKSAFTQPDSSVEEAALGEAAEVRRFLCGSDQDFNEEIRQAQVLLIWHNIPISAAGIAQLKQCRAIIRMGVGYDSVDIAAAREAGIPVCNIPDYGTEEVADHAMALALALCRQLFPLEAEARQLGWTIRVEPKLRRLRELNFGIIGLGRIGTATALRAKAFGFKVSFYDPYLPNGVEKAIGIQRESHLDDLLKKADLLSLHCPLSNETRHLIAERELALMKPAAFIVNTARGAIIKKAAILDALREERLAGAGLDVIEDEPLQTPAEAATPNLIATCHAAFCSVESKLELRASGARLARAALLGQPLPNVVN
jgi:phosphoglycerate dehydrogenase-like enzyme